MVSFATDPGTDVFLRGLDAGERARKARQAIAVDTAVRRGLAASMGMSPPDAAGAPALAPAPAADGAAPAAAPPPQPALAPAPQGAPQAAPQGGPVASPPPSPAPAPAPAPRPALAPAAAMPGAQPVGDRYEPVLRELAQVEGGGAAALGVLQQQDRSAAVAGRRQDQLARMSMYALSKGDVATGQYFASQAGIPLPNIQPGRGRGGAGGGAPGVQQARLLGTATLAARRLYGNDVGQAQRFTQAYIQNGGDIAKAIEAAGDPTQGPIRQWRWRQNAQTGQEELVGLRADGSIAPATDDDGKPFVRAPQQRVVPTPSGYATVDPQAGTARPVTQPDGTQLPAPQRGGALGAGGPRAAARPLDREVKRDMLIAAGVSPTEAALIAAGGTLSPSAAAAIRQRIIAAVEADWTLKGDTPDKIRARQDAVEKQFRQVVDALSPVRQGGGAVTSVTPSVTPVTPAPALPRAPAQEAPAAPLAPAPAAPPAPAPAPQAAATAAPPAPPRDPAQRQPGNVYTTPRGPMRWTGTGWVQP